MPRPLPKNVYSERTRHGRIVFYFRNGKGLRIRLPDIREPRFHDAVRLAEESGISVPRAPVERPSFAKSQRLRIGKTLNSVLRGAKTRAMKRGIAFDLDLDWALDQVERQGCKCLLTSIPFFMQCDSTRKAHPFSPSLDRITPSEGYVRGNVRIVVLAVNLMLNDWGPEIVERVMSGWRYTKGTKVHTLFPRKGYPSAPTLKSKQSDQSLNHHQNEKWCGRE